MNGPHSNSFKDKITSYETVFMSPLDLNFMRKTYFIFFLFLFSACSSSEENDSERARLQNAKGEYLYRRHHEYLFKPALPVKNIAPTYPWENFSSHKVTKEFFRCKGSSLNPPRLIQQGKEIVRFADCGGSDKHSLPLRNGKEFIYPILIDLLNYIQDKSDKRVVVTSGHRCPEHNAYVDSSKENQASKHMIGAEVSFYVQGWEDQPLKVIQLIQNYYLERPQYKDLKDFQHFVRYEKGNTNVSTNPWMNKEIFIKLFNKKEGRNFDNRHPYPYISIQVRYDTASQEKVIYTWEKANRNFLRK